MGKKTVKLSDDIRKAVDTAGVSRQALCRAARIDPAAMSRFMAGTVGLRTLHLDSLAAVLGLRIVVSGQRPPIPVLPMGRPRKAANAGKRRA